ncbi:MAG: hypothetical protein GY866_18575 [Proteobacteria bacterium]|nr:hypothetical protein [Pseudomonadota bacterium]
MRLTSSSGLLKIRGREGIDHGKKRYNEEMSGEICSIADTRQFLQLQLRTIFPERSRRKAAVD